MHIYRSTRSSSCFVDGQYTTSAVVLWHRRTRRGSSGGNGHKRSSRSKLCTYWSGPSVLAGRWGWGRRREQGYEEPFYGDLIAPSHTNVCCVGFVLEQAEEYLLLFDEDLFVLASLVSFPEGVAALRPKISFMLTAVLFAG